MSRAVKHCPPEHREHFKLFRAMDLECAVPTQSARPRDVRGARCNSHALARAMHACGVCHAVARTASRLPSWSTWHEGRCGWATRGCQQHSSRRFGRHWTRTRHALPVWRRSHPVLPGASALAPPRHAHSVHGARVGAAWCERGAVRLHRHGRAQPVPPARAGHQRARARAACPLSAARVAAARGVGRARRLGSAARAWRGGARGGGGEGERRRGEAACRPLP